jgi:hypothetical protein
MTNSEEIAVEEGGEEILVKNLKNKEVYHYFDNKNGINVKSREVFKNGQTIIHYPFSRRKGTQKYQFIDSIIYHKMKDPLPHGFLKTWANGYGFTKELAPVLYFLQKEIPSVSQVTVSSEYETKLERNKVIFNARDLDKAYNKLSPLLFQHKGEVKLLTAGFFCEWFPKKIEKRNRKYNPGQLGRLIHEYKLKAKDLSEDDTKEILELISSFPPEADEVKRKRIISTKEAIEQIYIESILQDFKKLISQKNNTTKLEERWQKFFKENSWIFSQLFSYPMVLFKDKAYVGGKTVFDSNGKIADFLYKNEFSDNVAIIEIKTHKSNLLDSKPYRGSDVFPVNKELSGAMNQVLDHRDNLQKEFYTLCKDGSFNTFNSKCIVIIGQVSSLKKSQLKSFELFRNNNKDVEVVTFDELQKKISNLLSIFKK